MIFIYLQNTDSNYRYYCYNLSHVIWKHFLILRSPRHIILCKILNISSQRSVFFSGWLSFEEFQERQARPDRQHREQQNQLFIRIGREKVLIIRSKYNLNTQKCTTTSPFTPVALSFFLSLSLFLSLDISTNSCRYPAVTLRHNLLLLTVNNHLYFQLALLIRRRRHCRSLKKCITSSSHWGNKEKRRPGMTIPTGRAGLHPTNYN